jgi:hypothetical protein
MYLITESDAALIKVALTFLASSISDPKDLPSNCRQHWVEGANLNSASTLSETLKPASSADLLKAYTDAGGDFGSCTRAFAAPDAHPIVQAARLLQKDGELEFDDRVVISEGDDDDAGAYVLAWVWVDADQACDEDDGDDE